MTGKGGDEAAFGTIPVETDVERLRKFEIPLGEGAGVERVEEPKGRVVRILVVTKLIVVLLMGEKG